jgi:hypothetical protein
MCVLKCNNSVAASKKYDVGRHVMTVHTDYIIEYPANSEIYGNKLEELKCNLYSTQAIFSKSNCKHIQAC